MKVQLSIDDDLMKRVDDYVENNYMSRSGLVTQALNQFLLSNDVCNAIVNMSISMQKIADTGKLDRKTRAELDDFKRLAVLISKNGLGA